MIYKKENCKISLDININCKCVYSYTIYSYQRIILNPQEKKDFYLPYYRDFSHSIKYFNFELDKQLIEKGVICIYTNINDESSSNNIIISLKNDNFINDKEMMHPLSKIIGSTRKIDLIPNTILGKIFI